MGRCAMDDLTTLEVKEAVDDVIQPFEALQVEERQQTQVNTYKLNLMRKYKKK